MEKFYFVMPAYNESENIKDTIAQWYPVVDKINKMEGCEAILTIANDGSVTCSNLKVTGGNIDILATDYKTKNSNNGYCFLGRLTSKAATISVKCTAWFEGTDPNVVNEALNQVVITTQRFYVRKLAKIK